MKRLLILALSLPALGLILLPAFLTRMSTVSSLREIPDGLSLRLSQWEEEQRREILPILSFTAGYLEVSGDALATALVDDLYRNRVQARDLAALRVSLVAGRTNQNVEDETQPILLFVRGMLVDEPDTPAPSQSFMMRHVVALAPRNDISVVVDCYYDETRLESILHRTLSGTLGSDQFHVVASKGNNRIRAGQSSVLVGPEIKKIEGQLGDWTVEISIPKALLWRYDVGMRTLALIVMAIIVVLTGAVVRIQQFRRASRFATTVHTATRKIDPILDRAVNNSRSLEARNRESQLRGLIQYLRLDIAALSESLSDYLTGSPNGMGNANTAVHLATRALAPNMGLVECEYEREQYPIVAAPRGDYEMAVYDIIEQANDVVPGKVIKITTTAGDQWTNVNLKFASDEDARVASKTINSHASLQLELKLNTLTIRSRSSALLAHCWLESDERLVLCTHDLHWSETIESVARKTYGLEPIRLAGHDLTTAVHHVKDLPPLKKNEVLSAVIVLRHGIDKHEDALRLARALLSHGIYRVGLFVRNWEDPDFLEQCQLAYDSTIVIMPKAYPIALQIRSRYSREARTTEILSPDSLSSHSPSTSRR